MNLQFTFTLPAWYCSSKISRFQSFHLPPRRLSILPLHLQCPRWWQWRRPQRWQRVEEAGTCGGAPSLPSVTMSSSSSPSPLDSTLPSPRACRRCSPSQRQHSGCLCRLWPPALAQAAWNCSTQSRPQPRGWQLALRLAGSADAAQGLLGAAAQLHPWRRYVEVVMA